MSPIDKKQQLAAITRDRILPLIDNDYLLLDLPYHSNLGDTLIWQGTLDLLKDLPYKCKYSSWLGCDIDNIGKYLTPDTIICFNGGGNFGDVWEGPNDFRKRVIKKYPHNKTIVFPQTVFYEYEENMRSDANFYSQHPNVIICVRDNRSFQLVREHFPKNKSLLVPDMAFCMDMKRYKRTHNPHGVVFVRRTDKEINNEVDYQHVPEDADVSDWLFLGNSKEYERQKDIVKWASRFDCRLGTDWKHKWLDLYWHHVLRPLNVKTAIRFLDRYEQIYTTRMHAAILSVILGKEDITLFDNSYGKSSSFFNTWLADVDGACLVERQSAISSKSHG